MILTMEHDVDKINMNQHNKYVSQVT